MMNRWMVLGLVLVAACGGKEEGPKAKLNPLSTKAGLCEAWAAAACNTKVLEACRATQEGCLEKQTAFCEGQVTEGPWELALGKACVAEVKAAYADTKLVYDEWRSVVHPTTGPCGEVAVAQAGGGGAPPVIIPAGDPCNPGIDVCVETHYCREGTGFCVTRPATGQPCCEPAEACASPAGAGGQPARVYEPCDPTSYCGGPAEAQVCIAKGGTNDECTVDEQCAPGLFCIEGAGGNICTDLVILGPGAAQCEDLGS